jgi:hypothetical protein
MTPDIQGRFFTSSFGVVYQARADLEKIGSWGFEGLPRVRLRTPTAYAPALLRMRPRSRASRALLIAAQIVLSPLPVVSA